MDISELARVLDQHGLICRGGFYPSPSDDLPETTANVLLISNAVRVILIAMGEAEEEYEGVDSKKMPLRKLWVVRAARHAPRK